MLCHPCMDLSVVKEVITRWYWRLYNQEVILPGVCGERFMKTHNSISFNVTIKLPIKKIEI